MTAETNVTMNEKPPRSRIRLRFINAGVRHAEIEQELGFKPTYSHIKGDPVDEFLPDRLWGTDSWVLEPPLGPDTVTAEQLEYMSSLIEKTKGFIGSLANSGVTIEFQCILCISEESILIPASVMATLSKCGIHLVIQQYSAIVANIDQVLAQKEAVGSSLKYR